MTTIDQKQHAILSSLWTELEEDGPVTLDRLTERLSGYIAWDGMPTDDAAHVLSVGLPRIEKAVAGAGAKIAKEIRAQSAPPVNEVRELEERQIKIAAEALAVITPRDSWQLRMVLNEVVRDLQGRPPRGVRPGVTIRD